MTARPRGGFALPFVCLMMLLLALMAAGSLATVTVMQRSGTTRGSDLSLTAAALDAAARARADCPIAMRDSAPGAWAAIPLADSPVGTVTAGATRLAGSLVEISGAVTDARPWSPSRGARRRFRLILAVPASADTAQPLNDGCGRAIAVWRSGLDW